MGINQQQQLGHNYPYWSHQKSQPKLEVWKGTSSWVPDEVLPHPLVISQHLLARMEYQLS